MGVDVVDLAGVGAGTLECLAEASDCSTPFVVTVGDPEGIGGRSVADDLTVNLGTSRPGVLQLLEDHHPGPLAQDEAIAVPVERARRPRWFVVASRERGQEDEARQDQTGGSCCAYHPRE